MSISKDVNQNFQVVKIINRTWRVECFTDYQTDYTMRAHRERLYLGPDGSVVKREELPIIERRVSHVITDAGAMTMLKAVKDTVDAWAVEDGES